MHEGQIVMLSIWQHGLMQCYSQTGLDDIFLLSSAGVEAREFPPATGICSKAWVDLEASLDELVTSFLSSPWSC